MTAAAMLDQIRIAAPCKASWEEMKGDERSRFCAQCRLNVYNLSGMTREEAERLIRGREGRVCVRLFRREDGTVLTRDCPVGLAALRRRMALVAAAVVGVFLSVTGALAHLFGGRALAQPIAQNPPAAVAPAPPPQPQHLMGRMAVRPQPVLGEPVMGGVAAPPRNDGAQGVRPR